MIDTANELEEFFSARGGSTVLCAVDTEADSLHRYQESLCLVQFSDGDDHVLIDPLAIDDLTPLKDYLEDSICWMHGADYDMHMLKTNLGMIPPTVFDTQIGARLLGVRQFGYGNLVEHYMGVSLEKTSQKADWAKRPLTEVMEKYALNDVIYLLPMAEMIVTQLKEKGRYEWFVESCEAARAKSVERVPVVKEDRWRIKGSGVLDPKGLNYLKALWMWRDAEAANWDRPPFMVCGNKQIIEWVQSLLSGGQPRMPRHFRPRRLRAFDQAVKTAESTSSEDWPQRVRGKRRRKDKDFEAKLNHLIAQRNKVAEELDIEGSLVAARTPLEAIASGVEGAENQLMSWQRELLGM